MRSTKTSTNGVLRLRTAAIGIGSNSLRMLLADVTNGELRRVGRYREGLRIFAALNDRGNIAPDMIRQACEKVGQFVTEAKKSGAETIFLFATSAVRDAENREEFAAALENVTNLKLEICSGEMEARLSYIGATGLMPSGLIDIGGGSTEIAVGQGRQIQRAVSLQMGAVRLFRLQPIYDIPTAEKVVAMAAAILAPQREAFRSELSRQWVGVGGAFTTAAALAQRIPWQDRERIHHYALTRDSVERILRYLAPMTVEERLKLSSMQPQRADIVVHGMAILLACMKALDILSIEVSEYGNLEGFLKVKYLS